MSSHSHTAKGELWFTVVGLISQGVHRLGLLDQEKIQSQASKYTVVFYVFTALH